LKVLAEFALTQGIQPPFAVINESRLKRWNFLEVKSVNTFESTQELEASEVDLKGLLLVSKNPTSIFKKVHVTGDIWSHLPSLFKKGQGLRLESKPDALNPTADYAQWSGERHRRHS
jgi:hypothetical protein